MRKEQDLNRNRQRRMQHHHHNQQGLTRLLLRSTNHRIQILDQKEHTKPISQSHQHIIQRRQRAPAQNCNQDPNQIRVSIQRPTLHQLHALGSEPLQHRPQRRGYEGSIPIHQPRRAGEELEVVREMRSILSGQVLRYRSGEEEDDDDGGGDPEGPVEVGVAVQDVEEGRGVWEEGEEGGAAAAQHGGGVDVEELGVEGEGPEVAFRG